VYIHTHTHTDTHMLECTIDANIVTVRRRPGKSQEPFVYKKEVENNYADC
jgi:hypothetical protein